MIRKFEMPFSLLEDPDTLEETVKPGSVVSLMTNEGVGQWIATKVEVDRDRRMLTIWCDDDAPPSETTGVI